MTRWEVFVLLIFSDTHLYTYVVYKIWADSDQNSIFINFFICSKIGLIFKRPILSCDGKHDLQASIDKLFVKIGGCCFNNADVADL